MNSFLCIPPVGVAAARFPMAAALLLTVLLIAPTFALAEEQSLDDFIADYMEWGGYEQQDPAPLDELIEASLNHDPASVFVASADLGPILKSLVLLEAAEGVLERARFSVTVFMRLFDDPPAADPVPVAFVQIDRYNLGPIIRSELVESVGEENVAPEEEFGVGPHVSWRLVMRQLMGNDAAIIGAGRAEIMEEHLHLSVCLTMLCVQPAHGIDEIAVWHDMRPIDAAEVFADAVLETERDGLPTPIALTAVLEAEAFFNAWQAEAIWEQLEPIVAEVVIETNLGQDFAVDAALRQGNLLDDSLAAIWTRVTALPAGAADYSLYTAVAYECRRGDGGFAPPGELCL